MSQYIGTRANGNLGDIWAVQENGNYRCLNNPTRDHELTQAQIDHDERAGCMQKLTPEQFKVKLKFNEER